VDLIYKFYASLKKTKLADLLLHFLAARYQQDFDKGFSKAASERFYHQAVVLSPDNGKY